MAMVDNEVIQRFLSGEAGQQLRAQYAAEKVQERRESLVEIERREVAFQPVRDRLQADADRAANYILELRDVLAKAERELARAHDALRVAKFQHDTGIDRLRAQLRATAPEVIAAFDRELLALADETRKALSVQEPQRRSGPFAGRPGYSNGVGIRVRLAAIAAARDVVEQLRYAALPAAELAARLQELRNGLPEIGPTVEIT